MGDAPAAEYGAIVALLLLIVACLGLGALAQRTVARSSFLSGYFLGNRGLGPWALALTATIQSGGTFMGYPSLVYTFGWVGLFWIAGYMIVPLTGFGILGKRCAQLSRRTGAITVPDLFRARFDSPAVGLAASLLLMFFIMFTMVAQFKAGAIVMKVAWPGSQPVHSGHHAPRDVSTLQGAESQAEPTPQVAASPVPPAASGPDRLYLIGLAVFTVTVVGYTLVGGFLASVWTDLFQSVLMAIGVSLLLVLSLNAAGGLTAATEHAVATLGPGIATAPGYSAAGPAGAREFLPPAMAFSFFMLWVLAGVGHPAGTVRMMASKDTATLRRSIVLLSLYNLLIYVPLAIVCICARKVLPPLEKADEVVPRMAMHCVEGVPGGTLLTGLIMAAPFGAVMATVSTFLVVIASGIVRDIYQRFLNPAADTRTLRRLTYAVTIIVGAIAILANINPVEYLQVLIVFSGSGAGATFVVPTVMACFWRRATAAGALASMFAGAGTVLALLIIGLLSPDPMTGPSGKFRAYFLFDMDPFVWGLLASAIAGVAVSLVTKPVDDNVVRRLFDARRTSP